MALNGMSCHDENEAGSGWQTEKYHQLERLILNMQTFIDGMWTS